MTKTSSLSNLKIQLSQIHILLNEVLRYITEMQQQPQQQLVAKNTTENIIK